MSVIIFYSSLLQIYGFWFPQVYFSFMGNLQTCSENLLVLLPSRNNRKIIEPFANFNACDFILGIE